MGIFGFDVLDFSQLTLPCVHPEFAVVQWGKKGQSGLWFVPVTTNWPESPLASNVALSLVLAWWRALIKMAAWYSAIQTKNIIQQLRLSMASMAFSPMGMVSKAYHPYEWCLSPTYNKPTTLMHDLFDCISVHAVIDFSFFQRFLSPTKNCCESQNWMTLFNSSPIDRTSPAFDQHVLTTHGFVLWSRVSSVPASSVR